ncbi:Protein of unknown function (DUF1676) [Popillia japonica]|uniref:PIR Superfamily Protein n=1 Tax=Popillia japonica TaxID=7064 RepID=A0AAW1N806_POPJA
MITQERLPLISVNNIQSVRSLNDSEKYEDNPSENEGFNFTYVTEVSERIERNKEIIGRSKGQDKGGGFLQKILPFMVIPFMISSSMIPVALTSLKFMLLKSAFIGKMAIILLILNMFLRVNNGGGLYSHNVNIGPPEKNIVMSHYGYNGDEEYGAYINNNEGR